MTKTMRIGDVGCTDMRDRCKNAATNVSMATLCASHPWAKKKGPRSLRTEGLTARRTVEPCTRHGRRHIAWHHRTCDPTTPAKLGC